MRNATAKTIRRAAIAILIATAALLAGLTGSAPERADAHPEHPGSTGFRIESSASEANTGDTITLAGFDFDADANAFVLGRTFTGTDTEPETTCSHIRSEYFIIAEPTADSSGAFTVDERIEGSDYTDADWLLVCGEDSSGDYTARGALVKLNSATYLRLAKDRIFPGETVRVRGGGFSPESTVTIFAVKNDETCAATREAPIVTADATREGDLPTTDFPMEATRFYEAIQWTICAEDQTARKASGHLHVRRIIRNSVDEQFTDENIIVLTEDNEVSIIPGLPDSAVIIGVTLGGTSLTTPDAAEVARTSLRSTFTLELGADADALRGGAVTLEIELSEPLDDESTIRDIFQVVSKYRGSHYLNAPAYGHPEDVLKISGAGFAPQQSAVIYAVKDSTITPDSEGEKNCPAYDGGTHTIRVFQPATEDGTLPDTNFPLTDNEFYETSAWVLCSSDGQGNLTKPEPLEIRPTLRNAATSAMFLVKGVANTIRILPHLAADEKITKITLGPQVETTEPDLNRRTRETRFEVTPKVQLGTYQLTITITDEVSDETRTISAVFDVVESLRDGLNEGRQVSITPIAAGPEESISVSGSGFAAGQTARIYLQQASGEAPTRCSQFNSRTPDPSVTTTTDADGNIPATTFTLAGDVFRSLGSWGVCAVDGEGEHNAVPAILRIKRVLLIGDGTDEIARGVPTTVTITPPLAAAESVSSWNIGPENSTGTPQLTRETLGTQLTIETTLDPGTYTLRVHTTNETLERRVTVVGAPLAAVRVEISPDSAGPQETITVNGAGFAANQTTRIYLQQENGEAPTQCGPYDASAAGATATTETTSDGSIPPTDLKLEGDAFRAMGTWGVCAVDGAGTTNTTPAVLTIRRVLLLPEDGDTIAQNSPTVVTIAPAIETAETVTGWTIGPEAGPAAPTFTTGDLGTELTVQTALPTGNYTLRVTTESLTLEKRITVTDEAGGAWALRITPDEAGPEETVTIEGSGFAASQTVRIFLQQEEGTAPDECGPYNSEPPDPSVTTTTTSDGDIPATDLTLSGDVFRTGGTWGVCAVDGAGEGNRTPVELTIRRVLLLETGDDTIPRETPTTVTITPPLAETEKVTGWNIGAEASAGEPGLTRGALGTDLTVQTSLPTGSYTLRVVTDAGTLLKLITIIDAPSEDKELTVTPSTAGPLETVSISGTGFAPSQTTRIFLQQTAGQAPEECGPYESETPDPAITTTTNTAGEIPPVDFSLDDERFRRGGSWAICAIDGAGEGNRTPATLTIKRVLLVEGEGDVIGQDTPTEITIAPPIAEEETVTEWSIGPQTSVEAPVLVRDPLGTTFTVETALEPGTYTLRVVTEAETLEKLITIGDPIPEQWSITVEPAVAGPGETVTITGSGFTPDQTVRIFLQQSESEAPDECGPYDRELPDPSVRTSAGTAGDIPATEFTLEDDTFKRMGSWGICAVDGAGEGNTRPAVLTIKRVLVVGGGLNMIARDIPASIVITPALEDEAAVTAWAIGPETSAAAPEITRGALETEFELTTTLEPGKYTLKVATTNEALEIEVEVVDELPPPETDLIVVPDEAEIGDTVTISSEGQTAGQTVIVYAIEPKARTASADGDEPETEGENNGEDETGEAESLPACRGPESSDPSEAATADSSGGINLPMTIDQERFGAAGDWTICARDGEGNVTERPATLTVLHTLVVRDDTLTQQRLNRVDVHPPLATGITPTGMTIAGIAQDDPTVERHDKERMTLLVRTTEAPGRYTMVVTFSDETELTREIQIEPQDNPPTLEGPERGRFTEPVEITGSGFIPGSTVTMWASQTRGEEDAASCAAITSEDEGAVSWTTTGAEAEAITADETGAIQVVFVPTAERFNKAGLWHFCATDSEFSLTETELQVRLIAKLIVPNEGRVSANKPATLTITPPPSEELEVTELRLGKRKQKFTEEDGTITWSKVPDLLGTHILTAVMGEDEAETIVQILSGRTGDATIPSGAKECIGLTKAIDGVEPQGRTAMEFRFRLDPTDGLECPIPQPPEGAREPVTIATPEATTTLPSEEIVIELRSEYDVPSSLTTVIEVSSYDNRFGHRYRARGIRVDEATRSSEKHRIIIPPCTAWLTTDGEQAPCTISHAKEITVTIQTEIRLPEEASEEYATQVHYGSKTIWDLVLMDASLDANAERVTFNDSVTLTGRGFEDGDDIVVYGVNTTDESFVIPEEEETDEWDCRLIEDNGIELHEGRFNAAHTMQMPADKDTVEAAGNWQICATDEGGTRNRVPLLLTVDYEALPQTAGDYPAGDDGYVRINPRPPEDQHASAVTVDGEDVEFETAGERVRFVMPVNISGTVTVEIEFPDDLKAELEIEATAPTLRAQILETDAKARIGSLIRLEADRVSGEQICNPMLEETEVSFVVNGVRRDPNCVTVGANRSLVATVAITAPDGTVPSELVEIFNEGETAELTLEADDGAITKTEISLQRPQLTVTTSTGRLRRSELSQFQPLTVTGSQFPRDRSHYDPPQVGYAVDGYESWETHATNGGWQHTFRVQQEISEDDRLEFIPTINGVAMNNLAIVITAKVSSASISIEPGEIETGTIVTVEIEGVLGFVAGYRIALLKDTGGHIVISDHETGQMVTGTSDRDGKITMTFAFPEYIGENYDTDGTMPMEIQLMNNLGEKIPGAKADFTHKVPLEEITRPEPAPQLEGADGEPHPLQPYIDGTKEIPQATPGPTPTPGPRPVSLALEPGVKTGPDWTPRERPGEVDRIPHRVNHGAAIAIPGKDGRSIRLEWTHAGGAEPATGYRITRAVGDGPRVGLEKPHEGALPEYVDRDVDPGERYDYWIEAYNEHGSRDAGPDAPITVHTPTRPTGVPTARAQARGATIVTVMWTPELRRTEGVLGYEVQVRPVSPEGESGSTPDWRPAGVGNRHQSELQVTNLDADTNYEFRVSSYNEVGRGEWSEHVRATTLKSGAAELLRRAIEDAEAEKDAARGAVTPLVPEEEETGRNWWELTDSGPVNGIIIGLAALAAASALFLTLATIRRHRAIGTLRAEANQRRAPEAFGPDDIWSEVTGERQDEADDAIELLPDIVGQEQWRITEEPDEEEGTAPREPEWHTTEDDAENYPEGVAEPEVPADADPYGETSLEDLMQSMEQTEEPRRGEAATNPPEQGTPGTREETRRQSSPTEPREGAEPAT